MAKEPPKTEETNTQMSEDELKQFETLLGKVPEDKLKDNDTLKKLFKTEQKKPEPKPEPKDAKPPSESEQLAQTLMSDKEEVIKETYEDASQLVDTLNSISDLNVFQKATIMSKLIVPAAKMLKDQKTTLKAEFSKDKETTKTETELSTPKGNEGGEKYLKTLTSKMGLDDSELEKLKLVEKPKGD